MSNPTAPGEINIIFPAFAKLAEYLLDHDVDAQTVGIVIGKASRDLWTGAATKAAEDLGEERMEEIAKEEDLEKRFGMLRDEYLAKTKVDIGERLEQAAQQIVEEITKEE